MVSTVAKKFLHGIDVHGISLAAKTAICLIDKLLSISVEQSSEELLLGKSHRQTPTLMFENWGCTGFSQRATVPGPSGGRGTGGCT